MAKGGGLGRRRSLLLLGMVAGTFLFAAVAPKAFPFSSDSDAGRPVVPELPAAADIALVVLSVVLLVSAILVRTVVTGLDRENLQQRKPVWVQLVVFGLLLFGISALTQAVRDRADEEGRLPQPEASAAQSVPGADEAARTSRALGWALTGAIMALAVGVAGGTAWLIGQTRRRSDGDDLDPLLREIDEGYSRIEVGAEPREAVIACYSGMTDALERRGALKRPSDTPFEYLERALQRLEVSKSNARRLTELFEKARFSTHEADEAMRSEALQALDAVRSDLAAEASKEVRN